MSNYLPVPRKSPKEKAEELVERFGDQAKDAVDLILNQGFDYHLSQFFISYYKEVVKEINSIQNEKR